MHIPSSPLKGGRRHQGVSPFRRCIAVWWWLLSIALATRGRAGAADLSENPSGRWGFHVFGRSGWEKDCKIRRCVLEVLVGRFWSIFGGLFMFFWCCPRVKSCNLQCYCAFGIQKKLVTTCWKLLKYQCFARPGPQNTVNTVIFASRGSKTS